jgi:hypothetical protein
MTINHLGLYESEKRKVNLSTSKKLPDCPLPVSNDRADAIDRIHDAKSPFSLDTRLLYFYYFIILLAILVVLIICVTGHRVVVK